MHFNCLLILILVVTYIHPKDLEDEFDHSLVELNLGHEFDDAKDVEDAMGKISDLMDKYQKAAEYEGALTALAGLGPEFAVLGAVLSLIKLFKPSETSIIMKELGKIEQ